MGKADVLQGTLTLLVLKALSRGELHGYAIATYIKRASSDTLRVEEGSLYPALHRLEQDGLIKAEWGMTDTNRKARFYSLTRAGRKQLLQEEQSWARLTNGVARFLNFSSEEA